MVALTIHASGHGYLVESPTHEQTFAYGSEQHQQWITRGADRHLALSANFTNDPYVDRVTPREYDDFIFDFPQIRLSPDGRTFYYRVSNGHSVPVAQRRRGFLGLEEIRLLDNVELLMKKPHGYLSFSLIIEG